MAEVKTDISDFNVISELGRAPAAASTPNEELSGEVRRAIAELLAIQRSLPPGPIYDEIAYAINDLQSARGPVSAERIAGLIETVRTQAAISTSIATQNSTAAMYDVLEDYKNDPAVIARARAYSDAIFSNDPNEIVVVARRDIDLLEPDAPAAIKQNMAEAIGDFYQSDAARAQIATIQSFGPELVEEVSTEVEARKQFYLEASKNKDLTEAQRRFASRMLQNGAYAFDHDNQIADALRSGRPAGELWQMAAPALDKVDKSRGEFIAAVRANPALQAYIKGMPEPERTRLENDDQALRTSIRNFEDQMTPEKEKAAYADYMRAQAQGNLDLMSPENKQIIAYLELRPVMRTYATNSGMAEELQRQVDIKKIQMEGGELSQEQLKSVQDFQRIGDTGGDLYERATLAGSILTQNTRGKNKYGESNLATGVLVISFADTHGGMQRFQEMSLRMLQSQKSGADDPEASQYMQQYKEYTARQLLGESYDLKSPMLDGQIEVALREMGTQIREGKLIVSSAADGSLQVYDTGASLSGIQERSTLFDGTNFTSEYVGYSKLNSFILEPLERGEAKANDPHIAAALTIQTYRLYDDPAGQELIDAMLNGTKIGAEALQRAQEIAQSYRAPLELMASPVATQLASLKPEHYAYLQSVGAISAEGALNVQSVMDGALRAEAKYKADPTNYKDYTDEQIQALDAKRPAQPGEISYYEARVMKQAASRLLAVQTLETVREMGMAIEQYYNGDGAKQPYTDQMLLDEIAYSTIADRENFPSESDRREALKGLLMRDPYLNDRPELLEQTTDQLLQFLKENPTYLLEESGRKYEAQNAVAPLPVEPVTSPPAGIPSADPVVVPAAPPAAFDPKAKLDPREKEGGGGLFDFKSDLEKAVIAAVQNISPEERIRMLGGLEAIKTVEEQTKNNTSFISYNEIEKALLQLKTADGKKVARPEDIVDVNGNGFDIVDIQAALTPPATPAAAPMTETGPQRS